MLEMCNEGDDLLTEREEILSFSLIHKKSFRGKIWISERVFFVFCRKESTGRLMSFFIDSPDSHRLMTSGCRASTLETDGLFSTMFAGTITSKSSWLSDDLV
ncbi:unnamed protein product [Brassica oleracea var. botrytis]|nr:unnamed protein product [Brassica napus]